MCETSLAAAPRCAALVQILTNEKPRLNRPGQLIGKLRWPDLILVRAIEQFQQFHGVGVFLPTYHPLAPLTYWAPAKPLLKLGNIRTGDIYRIFSVAAHSEGEEARKLEDFWRVPRQFS